jgi:hypothetical protein
MILVRAILKTCQINKEDLNSYWYLNEGALNHIFFGKLALEEAMDMSQDRLRDE